MSATPAGPRRAWTVRLALPLLLTTVPVGAAATKATAQGKPRPAAKAATKVARPRAERGAPSGLGHVVRPGDSLWAVAHRYGVSEEALARANRLDPGQWLRVGRRLRIPSVAPPGSQEPPSFAEIVLGRPPDAPAVAFAWPVSASLGSRFGPRGRRWHGGIDLLAERGTPIRAAAPGLVVMSSREGAYGRVVKIWHHAGFMTVYAHNHENHVRVGDWVERGQVIATVGATGRASAPHLHFEIRLEGKKYDPLFWLAPAGTVEVAAAAP